MALVHSQIVTNSAANKRLFDFGHLVHGVIDVEQGAVVIIEIVAWFGVQTRRTDTFFAALEVETVHTVHIGRRTAKVGDIALKIGHLSHLFHLAKYRFFASASYEFALMRRNGAKCAATKATAVHIHRVAYHFVGGNGFAIVARVRQSSVR